MESILSYEAALAYARRLKLIPGFPYDEEAVKASAEDLQRWCRGARLGLTTYSPEQQAYWLVNEAREQWTEWLGTAALLALFRAKFVPPVPASNEAKSLGPKRPVLCRKCKDSSYVGAPHAQAYCDCEAGQTMKQSFGPKPTPGCLY